MWIQWLDEKPEKGKSVFCVAFGSLAEMTMEQLREIAWVFRLPEPSNRDEFMSEFKERVKGRGLLVKNQWSGSGFMSHCGWNSFLETDQHLNARMAEEYFRIGVKVVTRNKCIESKVKELMDIEGEKGKEMRKNVKKFNEKARNVMVEGGSSWRTLNLLIDEVICNIN
ncbi:hypothetical protein MKX03_007712 [Papaver bracteatum]|nr:hypothetical protein MKX03_007712 [Papaver bracteatum]